MVMKEVTVFVSEVCHFCTSIGQRVFLCVVGLREDECCGDVLRWWRVRVVQQCDGEEVRR